MIPGSKLSSIQLFISTTWLALKSLADMCKGKCYFCWMWEETWGLPWGSDSGLDPEAHVLNYTLEGSFYQRCSNFPVLILRKKSGHLCDCFWYSMGLGFCLSVLIIVIRSMLGSFYFSSRGQVSQWTYVLAYCLQDPPSFSCSNSVGLNPHSLNLSGPKQIVGFAKCLFCFTKKKKEKVILLL